MVTCKMLRGAGVQRSNWDKIMLAKYSPPWIEGVTLKRRRNK